MPEQINGKNKKAYFRAKYSKYYTWIGSVVEQPKNKAYSLLALTFLTIAFFVSFAIRPTLSTITNLRKQIEDDQKVELKLQEKINALSQIQTEMEVIKQDLPVLNTALPIKANIIEVIKLVEKLTIDNQATLSAIQIQGVDLSDDEITQIQKQVATPNTKVESTGEPIDKKLSVIPILFTVEGDYQSLSNLVAKVRKLPRILSVQNMSMLKNVGKIVTSIRVSAYYLPL